MSQSFIKKPDNGPHSALAGLGVLASEQQAKFVLTMRISYERAGRCFWHLNCKAQRHAPPMKIERDDAAKKETLLRCTACDEAGWYPHGSIGEVCCAPEPAPGVPANPYQGIPPHTPMLGGEGEG